MKIFFGKASQQELKVHGTEDLFQHKDEYFYNVVEYGPNMDGMDDFVITDSGGRSVPICTEHISSLITALMVVNLHIHKVEEIKELYALLQSPNISYTFE